MRVLLADDQPWLRSALRLLLEHEANIEVVGEAGNIRTLPLCVNKLRPDLLFLDWQLSGLETNNKRQQLMDLMRAIAPDLYIIALTNDDNAASCLLFGANDFINRAEPPERILTALRHASVRKLGPGNQPVAGNSLM